MNSGSSSVDRRSQSGEKLMPVERGWTRGFASTAKRWKRKIASATESISIGQIHLHNRASKTIRRCRNSPREQSIFCCGLAGVFDAPFTGPLLITRFWKLTLILGAEVRCGGEDQGIRNCARGLKILAVLFDGVLNPPDVLYCGLIVSALLFYGGANNCPTSRPHEDE